LKLRLTLPSVRAAVELIEGVVCTLPVLLYQNADGGGKGVADNHPGSALVESDTLTWRARAAASLLRTYMSLKVRHLGGEFIKPGRDVG
jgi:hypothetical protein